MQVEAVMAEVMITWMASTLQKVDEAQTYVGCHVIHQSQYLMVGLT